MRTARLVRYVQVVTWTNAYLRALQHGKRESIGAESNERIRVIQPGLALDSRIEHHACAERIKHVNLLTEMTSPRIRHGDLEIRPCRSAKTEKRGLYNALYVMLINANRNPGLIVNRTGG